MYHSRQKRQKTLAQQARLLLCVLLTMLAVYTAGCVLILERVRSQAMREVDEMARLYTNELDHRFLRISRSLFQTMMQKSQPDSQFWKYLNMIDEKDQPDSYAVTKLRELTLSGIWEYGVDYQLFIYLAESDQYYQLSIAADGSYTTSEALQQAITEQIGWLDDTPYAVKKKWNVMACDGQTYMCKIAQNGNVSYGCYVNVKSILEPFSQIVLGDKGYVRLVDEEGNVAGVITGNGISDAAQQEYEKSNYLICQQLSQMPFEIQMRISGERLMEVMFGSISILIILAAALIGAGAVLLIYLKRNILRPLQQFTCNLEQYDTGDYTFNLTENNLIELEQIDDKFRHMIHQIRRLKITLYEQELEKQKMEMDYLKLQIRPHFYLNCLNFIHSMIDFGEYAHARSMSRITADYLTYVFRNTSDMVPVLAEAEHCNNYLKILLLRYPGSFKYYTEVHEEVEDAAIFPFLIQIFVENAAKHALTLEEKILISVTVYPEDGINGKYVNIYISDTGKGFPEEVLERLQQGKGILDGGNHVGIDNCVKRFQYYYKDEGKIYFKNSPLGGAIVDIHIPYRKREV